MQRNPAKHLDQANEARITLPRSIESFEAGLLNRSSRRGCGSHYRIHSALSFSCLIALLPLVP